MNKEKPENISISNINKNNNTEIIINLDNPDHSIEIMKSKFLKKYPNLAKNYGNLSIQNIKHEYNSNLRFFFSLDVICFALDLIVIYWSYFTHFAYNRNNYNNSKSINIQRIFVVFLSLVVVLLLIIRYYKTIRQNNLKYFLSLIPNIPKQYFISLKFFVEVFIHLLMPYPKVDINFQTNIKHHITYYSLDQFLFFLSVFRLYVIFKIIRLWSPFSNPRSEKILKSFGGKSVWIFLYRSYIKNSSFIIILLSMAIIAIVGSCIFKVFENYQQNNNEVPLGNFLNCLWFIAQILLSLGYGDMTPSTAMGRLISLFISFFSVFLQSIFCVSILSLFMLEGGNEQKAYAEINLLYSKEMKNNAYNIYFNSYIKTKFKKILNNFGAKKRFTHVVSERNKMLISKEKLYSRVIANLNIPITLSEFVSFTKDQWGEKHRGLCKSVNKFNKKFLDCNLYISNDCKNYKKNIVNFMDINTRLTNLVNLMYLCGNIFTISSIDEIRKKSVVGIKEFEIKLKEFHVKYYGNKIEDDIFTSKRLDIFPLDFKDKLNNNNFENEISTMFKRQYDYSEVDSSSHSINDEFNSQSDDDLENSEEYSEISDDDEDEEEDEEENSMNENDNESASKAQ